ncbi:MAG: 7-carboxy-7-deazaguanine synthase QueE [Myxococcota bacterium]
MQAHSWESAVVGLRIAPDRLLVSEIFDSVQGEGPSVGRPCTFLRLGLCNLRCAWCDTPYTWDASRYDLRAEIRTMDLATVRHQVSKATRIVLTGGEPLLQQEALEALLHDLSATIEVETAGTLVPRERFAEQVAQWNVSPKLTSAGNGAKSRVDPALRWFAAQPSAFFKFVVQGEGDLVEAREMIETYGIPADRVWLMPEGTDAETLASRSAWLADHCIRDGYNLGTRLHITLWGDRRGV